MATRKFPRDFLLAELKRVARELGKIPTIEEFRELGTVAPETLISRFGSWSKALESAGFDPKNVKMGSV